MPADLAQAVWQLDRVEAEIAIETWCALSDQGRSAYYAYLDTRWTRRGRRKRCKLIATALANPGAGFGIDFPR